MKEKVFILITNMNIGGTEKALLNMLEVMDCNRYDVDLWLLENKGGYLEDIPAWVNVNIVNEYADIKSWIMDPPLKVVAELVKSSKVITAARLFITHMIYKMGQNRSRYYFSVLSQMETIEKLYDTAIVYTGPFDFASCYVLKKVKANQYIQWIHFDVSKFGFNEKLAKEIYPRFQKIVAVSSVAAKELERRVPSVKGKVEVIPNFVPISSCMQKATVYEAYPESKEIFKLLTVGRLSAEKGQIMIPDIVEALLRMGMRNFKWYIVGEGRQRELIEKRIFELNISEYIEMAGLKKNPYPYYRGADLYVQTSLHEGYCITIAEAKIFNKYVISTDVAGAHDQIKNLKTGRIVEQDANCMAEAIYQYWFDSQEQENGECPR